jgi:1-acyl-sn-glycerol-3-phosphate acyltransferase
MASCTSCAEEQGDGARPTITWSDASDSLEPHHLEDEEEEEAATPATAGVGVLEAAGVGPQKEWRRTPQAWDPWLSDSEAMRPSEVIAALVVAPLRVAFCLAVAAVLIPVSVLILALSALLPERLRCSRGVRRAVVRPIRILCRIALLGAGYWWIHTEGKPEAPIIVSNHVSVGDVLYMVWALAPAFLAKREALRIPYVGQAARALGCVFVDRSDPESRVKARAAIAERAAGRGGRYEPPLLIFPEGTTTNGLSQLIWEKGAFTPGFPVSPVAIAYPKGQLKPDALFSVETLLSLCRPANWMYVTFLPRYIPNVQETASPSVFAAGVRMAVARTLDLPACDVTFRAGLHRHRTEQTAVPPNSEALRLLRAARGPLPWQD